jgi:hypothetical protein
MSDVKMPEKLILWMQGLMWGSHHDQWHFERRWDFWHHLAENGDPDTQREVKKMIEYARSQHWKRAELQEGEAGNGMDFLMMHRAMLHLIEEKFPEPQNLIRGWKTPPTDPADTDDPVPGGKAFDPAKAEGIKVIENNFADFASEDAYGLFIETNIQPIPGDPTNRDPDGRLGVHNYLHNRWTDQTSPINLGDPKVNIFNERFWKLHGWIDRQWGLFRKSKGLSDTDPNYLSLLAHYKHMMSGHLHPMLDDLKRTETDIVERPAGFSRFFEF